jgi:hypothetical protein
MARCSAITAKGDRCRGVVVGTSEYCAAHHPDYTERRRRGAAKGGKAKGNPTRDEVQEIRSVLRHATAQLLRPERQDEPGTEPEPRTMTRADCAVLASVCNVRLRLVEVQRKLVEQEELEQRLRDVEATLARRNNHAV